MGTEVDKVPFLKYPRPQLKRDSYLCLNGEWKNGIVVPFPLQSPLSGFKGRVPNKYTYEREFTLPKGFINDIVLLHFGAVDQVCEVSVNGTYVGSHEGGYNSFEFDITRAVTRTPGGVNTLRVDVTDTLSHKLPWGKQKHNRGGMWYTPVTGIWQSVWIESVSSDYIKAVEITPSLTGIQLNIESEANDFEIEIYEEDKKIYSEHTVYDLVDIEIENPRLWTPDSPFLYTVKIRTPHDEVSSYFGLRTITIGEVHGVKRILLNGKPFFFHGVLDQGYFPQGIYTPNSEKDFEEDIMRLKNLGFNTIRKHIKIEPEYFYEACDRLGMIVFQDMVNIGKYSFIRDTAFPTIGLLDRDDTKTKVKESVKCAFAQAMEDTLVSLYNHPSIVYYTLFNEGWGQFDSDMLYDWARSMDRTRIIDSTSGWFRQKNSDVDSLHIYFKSVNIKPSDRPVVLSEFGGISLKLKEHSWAKYNNYGYGKVKNEEELTKAVMKLYNKEIIPEIKNGLCGAIYTQITDVEDETNGFYTYDRKVCKVLPEFIRELSDRLRIEE